MSPNIRQTPSYRQMMQQIQIDGQGKIWPKWVRNKLLKACRVPINISYCGIDLPIDDEKTQKWLTKNLGLNAETGSHNIHSREGIDIIYNWKTEKWYIHNY